MSPMDWVTVASSLVAVVVSVVGILLQQRALKQKDIEIRDHEEEFQTNLRLEMDKMDLEMKRFQAEHTSQEKLILDFARSLEPADLSVEVAEAGLGFPYNEFVPVRQLDRFFGRRELISDVVDCIHQGMTCMALLGIRKAGKTSFLRYIEDSFTVERFPHIIPVYLDAQTAPVSPNAFYSLVLRNAASALYMRTKSRKQMPEIAREIDFQILEGFLNTASQQQYHFMLLLDELENLISEEKGFDDVFFGTLRSLTQVGHGQVSWITASYRPVYTPHTTTSPFGNIFRQNYVGPLLIDDACNLITVPAKAFNHAFTDQDVEFVLKCAGRLPFPLQKASLLLYKAKLSELSGNRAHIHVANEFTKQMREHFDYQHDRLSETERITLHQVAAGNSRKSDLKALQTLENYGFIEQSNEDYQVLGQAFDEYLFNCHLKR